MAGLNAIQILRGTSSTLNSSTQTLLPGQLVYNKDKNYLAVGSDIEDENSSHVNKSPIEVRRLVAYYEDTDSSISANTTPIFSIGDSSLGGSGHNLTLEYRGIETDAPDNYVALNDSTFFTNVQRINLTSSDAISINTEAMFVDAESSSVSMIANRISLTGGNPMQSGIGASTYPVALNAIQFGTINLTTSPNKGGTNNVEEAITLQSNKISLKSYDGSEISITGNPNRILFSGPNVGISNRANIISVDSDNTTIGTFTLPTINESNYNTLYTLATTANIANINDTLQTNTTTIYAPTTEYDPEGTINAGVAVRVNTSNGFTWEWRQVYDSVDSGALSGESDALVTSRDVYHGLPNINGDHLYTSDTYIYAPTSKGKTNQVLCGANINENTLNWKSLYAHYFTISLSSQTLSPPDGSDTDDWNIYVNFCTISSSINNSSIINNLYDLYEIILCNYSNTTSVSIPVSGIIYKGNTSYPATWINLWKSSNNDVMGVLVIPMYSSRTEHFNDATINLNNSTIIHKSVSIF